MQTNRRVIEDRADEAEDRITRWHAMREALEAMLCELTADDKQTNTDLGDAMNAIQEAGSALFMAEVAEQCTLPDLDANYPGRSAPGSH